MGEGTDCKWDGSTAMGGFYRKWTCHSTAMGYQTTASGAVSTAMGHQQLQVVSSTAMVIILLLKILEQHL